MTFLNECDKYGISIGDKCCCVGLFVEDIVLCASTRSQLMKLFLYNIMELSKKNCYIYLGVPFLNNLELKTIIQRINNKVRIVLYSIKEFLKNPHIPIPYKRMRCFTFLYCISKGLNIPAPSIKCAIAQATNLISIWIRVRIDDLKKKILVFSLQRHWTLLARLCLTVFFNVDTSVLALGQNFNKERPADCTKK
ncbi:hypothetical protein H8356DRAFT_1378278 [Neocallimastix lanati (nom. inval.)]|nr:hypothetical protein H8356DRAFT_1378278 [Neocallimastix sp. JGI-2020a]